MTFTSGVFFEFREFKINFLGAFQHPSRMERLKFVKSPQFFSRILLHRFESSHRMDAYS